MTKDKAQKQAIRARMTKTGERYTTARHYLLDLHRTSKRTRTSRAPRRQRAGRLLTVSGMAPECAADVAARSPECPAAGGRTRRQRRRRAACHRQELGRMVRPARCLARHDAYPPGDRSPRLRDLRHRRLVGAERHRRLRARPRHARDTRAAGRLLDECQQDLPCPGRAAFRRVRRAGRASALARGTRAALRTNQPNNSARFDVLPGDSGSPPTSSPGAGEITVQLQMERLADAEEVARWKALWKEQLARLADFLGEEPSR